MEIFEISQGTFSQELNGAINRHITQIMTPKNCNKDNIDMRDLLSENCLHFLIWMLVCYKSCNELETLHGLKRSGQPSVVEIDKEKWNDFTDEFIQKKIVII